FYKNILNWLQICLPHEERAYFTLDIRCMNRMIVRINDPVYIIALIEFQTVTICPFDFFPVDRFCFIVRVYTVTSGYHLLKFERISSRAICEQCALSEQCTSGNAAGPLWQN